MTRWSQPPPYSPPINPSHPRHHFVPSAHEMADAESFLLLTLPGATVTQNFHGDEMPLARGELA